MKELQKELPGGLASLGMKPCHTPFAGKSLPVVRQRTHPKVGFDIRSSQGEAKTKHKICIDFDRALPREHLNPSTMCVQLSEEHQLEGLYQLNLVHYKL
jgi:hypothetical protein